MRVFGVSIEAPKAEEAVKQGGWIVTANPEILLYAKRHPEYREILKRADVRTADGFGLWLTLKMTGHDAFRVTGVDLAERFLQEALHQNWKVGLFGGLNGEALESEHEIKKAYPDLQILAEQGGVVEPDGRQDAKTDEAMARMIQFGPQVLLVAMGHPRQEAWIAKHRADFPELKTVIGVGGTFNFWSGRSKRAPIFMQKTGLEWLWRLMTEPHRWKRIFEAVVVFPIYVIFSNN